MAAAVARPPPAIHRRSRSAPYFVSPVAPISIPAEPIFHALQAFQPVAQPAPAPAPPMVPDIAISEPWTFEGVAPPCQLSTELGSLMRQLGQEPAQAELQELVADFGIVDGLGTEVDEFLVAMGASPRLSQAEVEAELRQAFRVFDRDGSGAISSEELRHVMFSIGECLSDDEIDAMMREADLDGDGAIDYYEFVRFVEQM